LTSGSPIDGLGQQAGYSEALTGTSLVASTLGDNNDDNTALDLGPAVRLDSLPLNLPDPSVFPGLKYTHETANSHSAGSSTPVAIVTATTRSSTSFH
jgi:hypothetical protein